MAYQLIFIRASNSSFRIYVKQKHKVYGFIASGEFKKRTTPNIFIRFDSVKFRHYLSNTAGGPSIIQNFVKFIYDGRNIKILYLFFAIEFV